MFNTEPAATLAFPRVVQSLRAYELLALVTDLDESHS